MLLLVSSGLRESWSGQVAECSGGQFGVVAAVDLEASQPLIWDVQSVGEVADRQPGRLAVGADLSAGSIGGLGSAPRVGVDASSVPVEVPTGP